MKTLSFLLIGFGTLVEDHMMISGFISGFSTLLYCSMLSSVSQSCPTLCDPMECSFPGSSVHGIFQARIPEWVAISYSTRSSDSEIEPVSLVSPALAAEFFSTVPPGKSPIGLCVCLC